MESRKILLPTANSPRESGFTLLEILVVFGLFSVLGAMSLILSMDSYRGYAFHAERDSLVTLLERARSQAVNNVCIGTSCVGGMSHGVAILPDNYILFQGSAYATRESAIDEKTEMNNGIARTGLSEVVFSQLSGSVQIPGDIILSDGYAHTSTISINNEGRITWTN